MTWRLHCEPKSTSSHCCVNRGTIWKRPTHLSRNAHPYSPGSEERFMSENDEIVQVHRQGAVAIVTMNYPQRRNAFSLKMRLALLDTFQTLFHDDSESRAIVLTGAQGNFCSGGDLSEMTSVNPSLLAMR